MGYFLLQVYVPAILLVAMSWVTFWLNREATSDRVGLGRIKHLYHAAKILCLDYFLLDNLNRV